MAVYHKGYNVFAPFDLTTIIIDTLAKDSVFWENISRLQDLKFPLIGIGNEEDHQIPSVIQSNNQKDKFISGHHDNDYVLYLIVGKGGVCVTVNFLSGRQKNIMDGSQNPPLPLALLLTNTQR